MKVTIDGKSTNKARKNMNGRYARIDSEPRYHYNRCNVDFDDELIEMNEDYE